MQKSNRKYYLAALLGLVGVAWAAVDVKEDPTAKTITFTNNTAVKQGIVGLRTQPTGAFSIDGLALKTSQFPYKGINFLEGYATTAWDKATFDPAPNTSAKFTASWASAPFSKSIPLIKTGVCNQPLPYQDAAPVTLTELQTLLNKPTYYDANYSYVDKLGLHGGDFSGGFIDTYYGETQMLLAIPSGNVVVNGTNANYDPNMFTTPLSFMALSMGQEFFGMDQQWMFSVWSKETAFMLMRNSGSINWHKELWTNVDGAFGPGEVEATTYMSRAMGYPKFFPYDACLTDPASRDVATAIGVCKFSDMQFAGKYMGTSHTDPDKAQIVNATIGSGLVFWFNYDLLANSTCLGFKQALLQSTDKRIGVCAMTPLYNLGINSGAESALMGNSSTNWGSLTCNNFSIGNGNYRVEITNVANQWEANAVTSKVFLDRQITLDHIRRFYFGDNSDLVQPWTSNGATQDGGLMKHFNIGDANKKAMWDEIVAAFNLQAAHWGGTYISLRYDWLSNLRIAKKYLDLNRGQPKSEEAQQWIDNKTCGNSVDGRTIDDRWPFAEVKSGVAQANGDISFDVNAEELSATDRGIEKIEWTTNDDWTLFKSTPITVNAKTAQTTLTIPDADVKALTLNGPKNVYFRVTDSCGNAVVVQSFLKGDPRPQFNSATMFDQNGDGVADSLVLDGADDPSGVAKFKVFTSGQLNWYGTPFAFNVNGLNANNALVSKTGFGVIDQSKVAQNAVSLQYTAYSLNPKVFADSVGPAIQSATLKAGTALDTLTLTFTREITGIDPAILVKYTDFKGWAGNLGAANLGAPSAILSQDGFSAVFLVPTKSLMAFNSSKPAIPGDSVRITPTGPIVAKANQKHAQLNNKFVSIQYIKGNLKTPDLTIAQMFDVNGDGKADSLYFNGSDNEEHGTLFSSFTALNLTWYGKNFTPQRASVVGAYSILDPQFGAVDESQPVGQLSLNYVDGTIAKEIADSIGPVINSASLLKGQVPDANGVLLDTLVLNFSREVSGLDPTSLYPFLEMTGNPLNNGAPLALIVSSARTVRALYPAGQIRAFDPKNPQIQADSVKILTLGPLVSFKNNRHAAVNNQKVRIELNDGPLPILAGGAHAWFDLNGDGTMDMAQVQFKRTVDDYRLNTMVLKITWLKGKEETLFEKSYTASQLKVNNDMVQIFFGANDSISKYITNMSGVISGVPLKWGQMVVSQTDLSGQIKVDTVPMLDRMGPVIVKADLKKTSLPQSRPDYLDLSFSEELDTSKTKGMNIFEYRVGGLDLLIPHSPNVSWRSAGNALQVSFTPDLTERPSVGDSVRFNVQNFTGMAVDLAGNTAHKDHLRRNITGNTVYLMNAIPLGKLNVEKFLNRPFAFDTLFALDRKVNVENFAKAHGYSGFYVRMSFNDIRDSLFENKSDAELKQIRSQFRINVNAQIYSTLGEWVANYNRSLSCLDLQNSAAEDDLLLRNACDPRILSPNRDFSLFFPWNFRDYKGRFVGTGVYLLNPIVESSMGVKVKVDKPFSIGVIRD